MAMNPAQTESLKLSELLRAFVVGPPTPEEQAHLQALVLEPAAGDGSGAAAFEKPSDAEAGRLLVEIWNCAMPEELISSAASGQHWRRLGFQSANPYSDVRAGRLGLDQMHYLATRYPQKLSKFVSEAQDNYYPFACSCFNVTQMLVVFFDLYGGPCLGPLSEAPKADREQLRNFAAFCSRQGGPVALNELFCVLVEGLHETWAEMCRSRPVTLMDFPGALRRVHAAHAAFWRGGTATVFAVTDLRVLARAPLGDGPSDDVIRSCGIAQHLLATMQASSSALRFVLMEIVELLKGAFDAQQEDEVTQRQEVQYTPPPLVLSNKGEACSTAVPLREKLHAWPAGEELDVDSILRDLGLDVDGLQDLARASETEHPIKANVADAELLLERRTAEHGARPADDIACMSGDMWEGLKDW